MITSIRKKMNLILPKKINSEDGAILIISMFVLTVIFGLTACFSLASVGELNSSSRYLDSAEAFWAAEAGINRFIQDTTMLDGGNQNLNIGGVAVALSKDDTSNPSMRVVTAEATSNGIERTVSVSFPAAVPGLYSNTLSSGGSANIDGVLGAMDFGGQTRISGTYNAENPSVWITFDDLVENVDSTETTLGYADVDGNSTPDEFNDFVEYNRRLTDVNDPDYTGEYLESEVIYLSTNDTVEIWPDDDLAGISVIFVEGSAPGQGNVDIYFNSSWAENQNVTVVSTGSITYIEPLENPSANSQLNTLSWGNYNEGTIFNSSHSGVTYTHGSANFGSIASRSTTRGALIANGGIEAFMIFVSKEFDYEDPIDSEGLVPPAFQGLTNGAAAEFSSTPNNWSEVWEVASE